MKPLKRWQKNKGKKKMAQPQKCVVKPFMASLRGFEPRTFRLGEAPKGHFRLPTNPRKSLILLAFPRFCCQ